MATYSYGGTNYTLKATPKVGTYPYAGDFYNAQLYCLSDECYATGAALDAGSLMYLGKLPAGAVVQFIIIWPIDTATYGEGDAMTNAVTATIGISGDADLFGNVSDLNATATPQVIAPVPDGTTYTTTLDMALRQEYDVILTTAAAALTATEGVAVKILYTLGGRTYK